jgi:tRNA(Ile)-lysidine synthase
MAVKSAAFQRWWHEMRRSSTFLPGERVGVAVSGGPDSVLLLEFMADLARQQGLVVSVVHFNHRLRGPESDKDEKFVRGLARKRGLECHASEAEVAQAARHRRKNLEATARELRYRYFLRLISQGKLDKIATAHNANDQAETVLLRLLRGAGTRGLAGIYPVLEGKIVRPFLGLTRAEIEREVERRKLAFRTDSSNQNIKFRRNKIRLELLPLLERDYSPEAVRLLAELAGRARDDEAFLEEQARERARPWRLRENYQEKIPLRPLAEFSHAIARRVLRQMAQGVCGNLRGLTHRQIEELRRFSEEGQSGHGIRLAGGVLVRKEFDWLILEPAPGRDMLEGYSHPAIIPGQVFVPEIGATFKFKIVRADEIGKEYNSGRGGLCLDSEKLRGKLVLRNWRAGDRFQPGGSRRIKKLKELFREKRIPAGKRRLWPVLEGSGQILWVKGFPPAAGAAAPEGSGGVIVVSENAAARPGEDSIEEQNQTS